MTRVYLSATRTDLASECQTIAAWLECIGLTAVDSYGPAGLPVLESCLDDIDTCDIYLLVLGHYYGGRPADNNPDRLSYTQFEFRHATARGMPLIVLQRGSIPDESSSSIFDPEEMAALKAFREEVAGVARAARFKDENDLRAQLQAGLDDALSRLGLAPARQDLFDPLRRASQDLLHWPTTLPNGDWLERPELTTLLEGLQTEKSSTTLLLGDPGCGKSALLARLGAQMQEDGWPVLGIKADLLPENTLSSSALAEYLELPKTIVATVLSIAAKRPVLVLIDQLDALADLVVQHSSRLRLLLNLIRDLDDKPNVHVVASCRVFEQRHDPRLRNLDASILRLDLPTWEEIVRVLGDRGIQTGAWNADLRETLRSPHALTVYLELLDGTAEPDLESGFQGMLEVQWRRKVLESPDGPAQATLLRAVAESMAAREVLWLPAAQFEAQFQLIQALQTTGLLIGTESGGRIGFRHQTLYEFVRAKTFLAEIGSLTANVLARQASLRVRPLLWHALFHLRRVDPDHYQNELHLLWVAELRPHLRMLLIEFIGMQRLPLLGERTLAIENFDDEWFRRRFLNVAVGSLGWFDALRSTHLPQLMASPNVDAHGAQVLLGSALAFAPDAVLELLDTYWLPHADKDELSWRILAMGSAPPRDSAWVDRLVRIAERMNLASWAIVHAVSVVSQALPPEAPRLFAAWLTAQWRAQAPATAQAEESALKSTAQLLEGRELHELPAIAEAAPGPYVAALWEVFVEMLSAVASEPHSFVIGYRESHGLVDHLDDDDSDLRIERPFLEAMSLAVKAWAAVEPAAFVRFVGDHAKMDLMLVHRLLANGLAAIVDDEPQAALDYLCADPRRLALGSYDDRHRDSRRLIGALVQHLDATQFARLEAVIVGWHYYFSAPKDDDAETRFRRLRWDREHRLRLLRAFPKEHLSPPGLRLLQEEERAFPGLTNEDARMWCGTIESRVSHKQMQHAKDDDILNLFAELNDETEWDHPRRTMTGGAIQAGRELAQLAETDVQRAVCLIRALSPERNEIPVSDVIEVLVKAGFGRNETYALVEEFVAKGHNGVRFRDACAKAIEAAVDRGHPVPDRLIALLESWLVSVDPTAQDNVCEESERDLGRSLLWDSGGIFIVPGGNHPVLAALSKTCLMPEPPLMDRWLDILEAHLHRTESPRVWASIGWRYLRRLHLTEHDRALRFIDRLFAQYPTLLDTKLGVHLMAYLQHWIPTEYAQRWLEAMEQVGDCGAQGLGELLMLRYVLHPQASWTRSRIDALLDSPETSTLGQRVGVTHAVVHLWSEPNHRDRVHSDLLRLLAFTEEDVCEALGHLYWSNGFLPDCQTSEVFDALLNNPSLLTISGADRLAEQLEALVEYDPVRVASLAHALLDHAGESMGNFSASWYLSSEPLLAVALALQDEDEPHCSAGLSLFERMLEYNLPQAHELTLDLDRRMPNASAPRPARRGRRRKVAK
ncbi:MAG: DUF4062 domain-containing protein [Rhodocyclaceae bacterium]|nr:DUF4062 domain-containing protein [Rhodocyclaceae bacterium]